MVALGRDFDDLLVALADEGAQFMVVGGWALALHGHGRGTDDLDVWVRASPENAARVYRALAGFGVPVSAHQVSARDFEKKGYGYRFGIKPFLIEVLTTISGVEFDEAWPDRRSFELEGRVIWYLDRTALLANKRAAGRPKDMADVEWLLHNPSSSSDE